MLWHRFSISAKYFTICYRDFIPNRMSSLANITPDVGHIRLFILREMQMRTEQTERKETPTAKYSFSQTTDHRTIEG
jgi:hypothetical protein